MVTIENLQTGKLLDFTDAKITYIKQVSEIGDVTKLNSSFSWAMKFPKTPNNTVQLDGLGIVNSVSEAPYIKNYFNVYDNGIVIVRKGLLSIKETANDYKAYIQEGIIDFIKSISNDNIGEVIDLSELDHVNDVSTIVASFELNTYRYIIANYNGQPLANANGVTNLSPTALIPSINCEFLFNKIMAHYGWTYTGDLDISNLWMTYPNATSYDDTGDEVVGLTTIASNSSLFGSINPLLIQFVKWQSSTIDASFFEYVLGSDNTQYRCLATGNYKIVYNLSGFASQFSFPSTAGTFPFIGVILVNGVIVFAGEPSDTLNENTFVSQSPFNIGDIIQLGIVPFESPLAFQDIGVVLESNLSIFQVGVQDINFSSALIKYKVKDFFKEIMIRGALTSFTDIDVKNIDFISLDNRIDADVIDFSDKYIRRKKESYLYESYAQHNLIKHKYDVDGDDYDDGDLLANNKNLNIEKTLYEGKSHAPLEDLVTYDGVSYPEYQVNNFKMFDVDIKEDPNTGDLLATYKALKNRFYFMESEFRDDDISILGVLQNGFPIAKINAVSYKSIVGEKYSKINQLIGQTKIHDIELAMASFDVATLDLKKVYYFSQENAYYLLNSLKYVSDEKSVGEFILINRN